MTKNDVFCHINHGKKLNISKSTAKKATARNFINVAAIGSAIAPSSCRGEFIGNNKELLANKIRAYATPSPIKPHKDNKVKIIARDCPTAIGLTVFVYLPHKQNTKN